MNYPMFPREPSLYRYYTESRWLFEAIKDRHFRPRFSDEDFSWATSGNDPLCLWVPMVSFCDIPLDRADHHVNSYGEYVVQFSKEWGKKKGLNPVLYVNREGDLAAMVRESVGRLITQQPLPQQAFGAMWPMIPYLKPESGYQTIKFKRPSTECGKAFEQEMEWRFVPSDWARFIQSSLIDDWQNRTQLSSSFDGAVLGFALSDIEGGILKGENERHDLLQREPLLDGRIRLWSEIPK